MKKFIISVILVLFSTLVLFSSCSYSHANTNEDFECDSFIQQLFTELDIEWILKEANEQTEIVIETFEIKEEKEFNKNFENEFENLLNTLISK